MSSDMISCLEMIVISRIMRTSHNRERCRENKPPDEVEEEEEEVVVVVEEKKEKLVVEWANKELDDGEVSVVEEYCHNWMFLQ